MVTNHKQSLTTLVKRSASTALLSLGLLLTPISVFAAESSPATSQVSVVQASQLSSNLAAGYNAHYFTLQPAERDGDVTLTLNFGPANNESIIGQVNFLIFTEQGVRDYQNGTKPEVAAFDAGDAVANSDNDYLLKTTFTASGRNVYTVMVYSRAGVATDYTLSVGNGTLVDANGQSNQVVADEQSPASATTDAAAVASPVVATESATQVDGKVLSAGASDYYNVVATSADANLVFNFDYSPKDNANLTGNLTFYVYNADGVNALKDGARPEEADIAAGNVVKDGETPLRAEIDTVGQEVYTVQVINHSTVPATYTLSLGNGSFQ